MKVVYITGCLGFIGSHVTRLCLNQGWYVRGIDKCTYAANLNLLTEFHEYDNFEFENEDASFVHAKNKNGDKEYKCFTCDKKELDYLREYTKKILRYNNSSNYAVGVMRLAYEAQKGLTQTKAE